MEARAEALGIMMWPEASSLSRVSRQVQEEQPPQRLTATLAKIRAMVWQQALMTRAQDCHDAVRLYSR